LKWKKFGREFNGMDIIFDSLFLLSKPESPYKLRVPLSAVVDYKGFRALAVGTIDIRPDLSIALGLFNGKYYYSEQKLKDELSYVGDILNLKENKIAQKG
jgi:hypothetical protein